MMETLSTMMNSVAKVVISMIPLNIEKLVSNAFQKKRLNIHQIIFSISYIQTSNNIA